MWTACWFSELPLASHCFPNNNDYPFQRDLPTGEWMEDVHLYVSLRLLGLPVEEQSAGYNGLLPPTQSCKYSLASLSLPLFLYVSVFLCVWGWNTQTHTHCLWYMRCHTLTISLIFFLDRMGRVLLKMESRLLPRYVSISETHTHTKMWLTFHAT